MEEQTYTVLIAEDDADIVELLKLYLENAKYRVLTAPDGMAAYELLQQQPVDLAILDIMMPRMNGYELTKKIRGENNIPIIILSAKNADSDKILGLDLGADDYLSKPFNPLEVVARVNSNLRRFYHLNDHGGSSEESKRYKVGDLELHTDTLQLFRAGEEVLLTPTEYKILAMLMEHPGHVFTKVQIYESIKGEYFESDDNTMMVHISKLREKIEEDSKNPKYLKTVRGLGYKMEKV
ncbi:MAG: response regulator transcription factor [Lachnospiraceae bacterium]|nr:response regulator transcription factor [Lachnospiraceae bacterium]